MEDRAAAETRRVTLDLAPAAPRGARAVGMAIAGALGVPLADATALVAAAPVTLPRRFQPDPADALVAKLAAAGARVTVDHEPGGPAAACATHPALDAERPCEGCGAPACALCFARAPAAWLCGGCSGKKTRSRSFFRARVAVLLAVLAAVLLHAWQDVRSREARTDWRRTLNVALIVVRVGDVDPAGMSALDARVAALEDQLAAEFQRHGGAAPPFEIIVKGPVEMPEGPPVLAGDGALDLARYSYDRWRYLSAVEARAGVERAGFDSRICLVVRPGQGKARRFVEGLSEQGGRVGVVEVELDAEMVDFALFVVAHELLHTLGASDKYDASGDVIMPDGLAEPELVPRLPQRYVEIMARHRPLAPGVSEPPDGLDDLRVGDRTAEEIGWRPAGD